MRGIRTLPLRTVSFSASGKGAANAEYNDATNTMTREYKKRCMLLDETVDVRGRVLAENRREINAAPFKADGTGRFYTRGMGTLCQYPWPCIVPLFATL